MNFEKLNLFYFKYLKFNIVANEKMRKCQDLGNGYTSHRKKSEIWDLGAGIIYIGGYL